MKRFVLAICILAVMICVGILSLWHSRHASDELIAQISYIEEHLDDREALLREVERLERMWQERETLLLHHMRHDLIDGVGSVMSRLRIYAEEEERANMRASLSELNWLFNRIHDEEQVSLDNIL